MITKMINGQEKTVSGDGGIIEPITTNPNLLDNPWFTVNQRGQSSYGANVYSVDRWKRSSDLANTGTITVNSGGVNVTLGTGNTRASLVQKIEDDSFLNGREITLSVKVGNNIYSTTGTWSSTTRTSNVPIDTNIDVTYGQGIVIVSFKSDTSNIRAIKLEIGSTSTLHLDTAPDYTTELLKCERFFWRMDMPLSGCNIAFGYANNATNFYAPFNTPIPMRATPTLTYSGTFAVKSGSQNTLSVSSISWVNNGAQYGTLKIISSGMTGDMFALLYSNSNNCYMDFDAEL